MSSGGGGSMDSWAQVKGSWWVCGVSYSQEDGPVWERAGAGEGLVKINSCFGQVKIVVKILQENLCRVLRL